MSSSLPIAQSGQKGASWGVMLVTTNNYTESPTDVPQSVKVIANKLDPLAERARVKDLIKTQTKPLELRLLSGVLSAAGGVLGGACLTLFRSLTFY